MNVLSGTELGPASSGAILAWVAITALTVGLFVATLQLRPGSTS